MSKFIKLAAAAALFSSAALGGAFAQGANADGYQPGDGDFYIGATPPSSTGPDGTLVDPNNTGSVRSNSMGMSSGSQAQPQAPIAGDMEYYEGTSPTNQ
ncbi:hypothetical protein [Ensifer soli]|uniref:hypothetical protein n=1 Tax=Ciceribacter sp. sgz301302 TaxID=3342379 RepID=UPI0035B71E7E